jgi:hypothetical protein
MKLTAYASHPSTRRPKEFTTWFRYNTTLGVLILTNSGWMETKELVAKDTVVELPDGLVRFQPESFIGSKGEQVTMNHIVAQ